MDENQRSVLTRTIDTTVRVPRSPSNARASGPCGLVINAFVLDWTKLEHGAQIPIEGRDAWLAAPRRLA